MNQELYNKLFARMDELGAIRKDLSCGCEVRTKPSDWRTFIYGPYDEVDYISYSETDTNSSNHAWTEYSEKISYIIGHPPVLSDCIKAHMMGDYTLKYNPRISEECQYLFDEWELSKPYLSQQSEELGQKLIYSLS